jgi:hypothetical protein
LDDKILNINPIAKSPSMVEHLLILMIEHAFISFMLPVFPGKAMFMPRWTPEILGIISKFKTKGIYNI